MVTQLDLLKAIRAGRLKYVVRVLDAGVLPDDPEGGEPGLALGIACFLGHADIVSELVRRGAVVNLSDNLLPTSPLSMAVRGKQKEVVRTLIQLGAKVPDGMETGLSAQEIVLAQWIAFRDGFGEDDGAAAQSADHLCEEIVLQGHFDTDTQTLEAETLRMIEDLR